VIPLDEDALRCNCQYSGWDGNDFTERCSGKWANFPQDFPQGLKPRFIGNDSGTTEVVPFQNATFTTGC